MKSRRQPLPRKNRPVLDLKDNSSQDRPVTREAKMQIPSGHGGKRTGAGRKTDKPRVGPVAEWLTKTGAHLGDFAREIGLSEQGLNKLIYNPGHKPQRATARRIEEATGGAVPFATWYPAD
jgi:hypothetical protein